MNWLARRKTICLIHCHPSKTSFNASLANRYMTGARSSGHEIERFDLYDMEFDPTLRIGEDGSVQSLETDLELLRSAIQASDHLVLIFPLWWFGLPSLLKGALDRILSPGWAFKFNGPFTWEKLLKGKSARIIYTMDSPPIVAKSIIGDPIKDALQKGTLSFVGFEPVKITAIGPVKLSNEFLRFVWATEIEKLGRAAS